MRAKILWLAALAALSCSAVLTLTALAGASESRTPAAPSAGHGLPSVSGPIASSARQAPTTPGPSGPATVLYDQFNSPGANATSSQHYEGSFSTYDEELADDFVVPAGQTWSVTTVDVLG